MMMTAGYSRRREGEQRETAAEEDFLHAPNQRLKLKMSTGGPADFFSATPGASLFGLSLQPSPGLRLPSPAPAGEGQQHQIYSKRLLAAGVATGAGG